MKALYTRNLHYFALLTVMVAILLIVAGATVTSTGSGDAVPDWPLSYGSLTPPMKGGILFEHSHRLIAGLTGILIAILAIWLLSKEKRRISTCLCSHSFGYPISVTKKAAFGAAKIVILDDESSLMF